MYRGLIQDGVYMTPYLREETVRRQLDGPAHRGRIWRIVPERWTPPGPVAMADVPSQRLVALLSDRDGWVRDTAQRILVERADRHIVPYLERVAARETDPMGRLHALWTLEGLNALSPDVFTKALDDRHPAIQSAALRLLEPAAGRYPRLRVVLAEALARRWDSAPAPVALDMALAARAVPDETALPVLVGLVDRFSEEAVLRDAAMSSLADREYALLARLWNSPEWQAESPGKGIFLEMLGAAVARRGWPAELVAAMSRLDEPEFGWRHRALAAGLATPRSGGPTTLPARPAAFDDLDRAALLGDLSAVYAWPGHDPSDAAGAVADSTGAADPVAMAQGRRQYLTVCSACHGAEGAGLPAQAPPLVGSEWVVGDPELLVRLVLHGIEGPIDVAGRRYDAPDILPQMPSLAALDDEALAATITYIRNAWGHRAEPVSERTVGGIRVRSQGRVMPWTAETLRAWVDSLQTAPLP
jgi:mono/diheme cytochrome c family protein